MAQSLGLDTTQPWGTVALTDGRQKVSSYAFIPVTDLKKLLHMVPSLANQPGLAGRGVNKIEVSESPNDRYAISINGQVSLYVQGKGNWAFVTRRSEDLGDLPADPAKLLGDLPKNYDLVARASMANIPSQFREWVVAKVQAGLDAGKADGSVAHAEKDRQCIQIRLGSNEILFPPDAMQQLKAAVNESEYLTLGWKVNPVARDAVVDFDIAAERARNWPIGWRRCRRAKRISPAFSCPKPP